MRSSCTLLSSIALACVLSAAGTQAQAGDYDDQFVVQGCVMPSGDFRAGGTPSLFVWSRGVYLGSPDARFRPAEAHASGATGVFAPVFYWIDDEDDVARYVGQRVEIVGELSDDLDKGEIDIDHHGDFTEIEFEVNGHEAAVLVPRAWLGPATADEDADFDVAVRTVDVEKVTPLGPCR